VASDPAFLLWQSTAYNSEETTYTNEYGIYDMHGRLIQPRAPPEPGFSDGLRLDLHRGHTQGQYEGFGDGIGIGRRLEARSDQGLHADELRRALQGECSRILGDGIGIGRRMYAHDLRQQHALDLALRQNQGYSRGHVNSDQEVESMGYGATRHRRLSLDSNRSRQQHKQAQLRHGGDVNDGSCVVRYGEEEVQSLAASMAGMHVNEGSGSAPRQS
jgi:hypothetical protein